VRNWFRPEMKFKGWYQDPWLVIIKIPRWARISCLNSIATCFAAPWAYSWPVSATPCLQSDKKLCQLLRTIILKERKPINVLPSRSTSWGITSLWGCWNKANLYFRTLNGAHGCVCFQCLEISQSLKNVSLKTISHDTVMIDARKTIILHKLQLR
jgi:hypothetical protein